MHGLPVAGPSLPAVTVVLAVAFASCGVDRPEGRFSCTPGEEGQCWPDAYCHSDSRCYSYPEDVTGADADADADGDTDARVDDAPPAQDVEADADDDGAGEAEDESGEVCDPEACDDLEPCNGVESCSDETTCSPPPRRPAAPPPRSCPRGLHPGRYRMARCTRPMRW